MRLDHRSAALAAGGWVVICGLLSPVAAHAQQPLTAAEQTARLHFQTGASYYETGNYAEALREFQRSYEISRRPELFHNYSRCYEHLGDMPNAVLYLRRYLQEVPNIENRDTLEVRLRNLEQRAAANPSPVPPESDTPPTSQPTTGGGELPVGPIVAFGVAGAALIAGGITGGLVLGEHSALQGTCGTDRSCTDADLSTMRALTVVTDVSFAVSLASAAVATVLLFVTGTGGESPPTAAIVPYVTADAAGVVVGGAL